MTDHARKAAEEISNIPTRMSLVDTATAIISRAIADSERELVDILATLDEHWSSDTPDGPESVVARAYYTDWFIATWRGIRAALANRGRRGRK